MVNLLIIMFNRRDLIGHPSFLPMIEHAGADPGRHRRPDHLPQRVPRRRHLHPRLGVWHRRRAGRRLLPAPLGRAQTVAELRRRDPHPRPARPRYGSQDSLGYFTLRRDKSVVFSPSGKSALGYRVLAGVALSSGDPLGDIEAWPGAIEEYLAACSRHGWVPAVLGCSERAANVWHRYNLTVLELGDEAVVDTASYTLEGRKMRGVRQTVNKVSRAGYVSRVRRAKDVDDVEHAALARLADEWRGDETERGFSMALSRLADSADPECVLVTAEQDGRVRGMLQFVPWGEDGLSLDLMRRDREADNGLNEFMITETARRLRRARCAQRLAELRHVPRRPRTRREDRRRPHRPPLGPGAAPGLPLVADRDPVPLQRQVPADLGAQVPDLPGRPRPAQDRPGRHGGRRLRRPPTAAAADAPAGLITAGPGHRTSRTRGAFCPGGQGLCNLSREWSRAREASPSLVYGAALLMRFGVTPHPGFKSRSLRNTRLRPRCITEHALPAPVAQRIEHLTTDQKVRGSNPFGRARESPGQGLVSVNETGP